MQNDAMLIQLGYAPNESLLSQFEKIKNNTKDYNRIEKHVMDLHDSLKVNNSYVALSNSKDYLKIKIDADTAELAEEAHKKVKHFSDKYKVQVEKIPRKETYYIVGYHH